MQVVAIDLVDQKPIGLDVAVALVLPIARQWVVLAARRQLASLDQQKDQLAQLRHVLAALLRELHIAPELRAAYRVPHRDQIPRSSTSQWGRSS